MKKSEYYLHGDIHIICSKIPEGVIETDDDILEHGEQGHYHRMIGDGYKILNHPDGRKFLRVVTPSDLKHEEHHTKTVPPGTYEVRRTKETCHMSGVTRLVAD